MSSFYGGGSKPWCLSHTPSSTLLYFHISSLQKPARTAVGPRPVSELDVNAEGWREGREQMPLAPAVLVLSSLRLPVMSDRNLKNAARNVLSLEYQSESESEVVQLCPTLRDPMDCSLPGSSIHGIFQARVLEWGALPWNISS